MEAPEKIYLTQLMLFVTPTIRSSDNEVEYARKDAFIEKACEYLEPILTEYAGFYIGGEILQHFEKYMKGV